MHGHGHGYKYGYGYDTATRAIFEKLEHDAANWTLLRHEYDMGTAPQMKCVCILDKGSISTLQCVFKYRG